MKRHLLLIALVGTIVLAACNKQNESQGEAAFTATTEHQGGRTSLDPNNGNINWTAGDQIVIANENDETAIFSLRSGGIQGGITNGNDVVFRVAFKPIPSIAKPQQTLNRAGEPCQIAIGGRHDVCALPRGVVLVEALAAMVTLDLMMF